MKPVIFFIIIMWSLSGCMVNYPMTTFYVKNNSGKTVNFQAGIMKLGTMGQADMMLPFTVLPDDSVLARRVGLKKGAPPTAWFTRFIIFPADSVSFNDPNDPVNWIPSTDAKGNPVYTFILSK